MSVAAENGCYRRHQSNLLSTPLVLSPPSQLLLPYLAGSLSLPSLDNDTACTL